MKKRWVLQTVDKDKVDTLQKALQINPLLCELLVQRGITTYEAAKTFFRPSLDDLHDPFLMKNMEKAVVRLEKAILRGEKIMLYGDYDVDGTTSVALMYAFLERYCKHLSYYIPDRYKEGYGISYQGIDYAHEHGYTLIIAMDCGIKAIEKVAYAKEKGIEFIICDHHIPDAEVPEAIAVLDPKQSDCTYPYKELSGCGVAFKLAQAYTLRQQLPKSILWELLDFLAISIGCDIVPITGENRVLAYYGLKALENTKRSGLLALLKESKRSFPLSIGDVVFGLGPAINAAGRLGDAKEAVRVLLSADKKSATTNAIQLFHSNTRRKEIERQITQAARDAHLASPNRENLNTIVLFDPMWHKGVVGIVASRMVDTFHRPTLILTQSEDKIVGSARSIKGFDLYEALKQCSDLLVNFGGHQHAAGLTIALDNFNDFKKRFEEVASAMLPPEVLIPDQRINAVLNLEDITPSFWNILKQFAPHGPQNMRPVFMTKNVKDTGFSKIVKEEHLKFYIKQGNTKIKGIGFGLANVFEEIVRQPFDICYTLQENSWKGKTSIEIQVKDVRYDD